MTPEEIFAVMTRDGDVVRDVFDAHVAAQPDKLFIHHGDSDTSLSFAEVRARADRMAAGLAALGVGKGDHVSVHAKDALVSALAMFAIWRCGAVFAPLNYNLRGSFLAYQISDTGPKVIIADAEGVQIVNDHRADLPAFTLVGPGGDIATLDGTEVPDVPLSPTDPAAIIYTSGTTGPAKGVKLGHRWINQYCFGSRISNSEEDVFHCDLPMYHVGGAFSIFARAAWMGASIGLWDRFSATTFWDRIARVGATAATLLDVMIPHILSQPATTEDRNNTLNKVHIQPYSVRHHEFAQRFGVDFITVGFGQTESGSVFGAVIDEFPGEEGTPPAYWRGPSKADYLAAAREVGRPIFDGREDLPKGLMGQPSRLLEVAALDEEDMPVPDGTVGQLCIRPRFPAMLLQEYINKPEATLKVLRNCWFHTGDAVRRRAEDGHYVFIDRMGGFFRVRGENVSSFEVESVLVRIAGVRAVAAVPVPASAGEEDDIAVFLECEDGVSLSEEQVRQHAAAEMPRYMHPRHIRFVSALPVTPTNKIEKYKLRTGLLQELAAMEERT
ncbi:AMP-binding protein [Pseudooceanicola sp. C21-150M6]|uniref:AMP-binding protein n=1 Tax=Pseudooceanicola sp. C21-150M6 TaxID=3434355 RepID=UPI003D7FF587